MWVIVLIARRAMFQYGRMRLRLQCAAFERLDWTGKKTAIAALVTQSMARAAYPTLVHAGIRFAADTR